MGKVRKLPCGVPALPPSEPTLAERVVKATHDIVYDLWHDKPVQVYVTAVEHALKREGLAYVRNPKAALFYRDAVVGNFTVDFLVEEKVPVHVVATPSIRDEDRNRVSAFAQAGQYPFALVLNFGGDFFDHEDVVNFRRRRSAYF